MSEVIKKTADTPRGTSDSAMDIKKTADALETVSEETAKEDAKDAEVATEKMIEKENTKEDSAPSGVHLPDGKGKEMSEKEREEKVQKMEEVDAKEKEKEKPAETGGKKFRPRHLGPTKEEIILGWNPITKLGNDVKSDKVKNIDEILDNDKKILEPEIVDKLLDVKSDLISIGQAKGKFGGGKRRAWRQTQRKTKEGNVMKFSAMAVVGNENGYVGIGEGNAKETLPARDKAVRKAKLNVIRIKRSCAAFDCMCSEPHTIPFEVTGKSGSVIVTLIPAPQGTGLVVGNELKKILRLAGIKDVYGKCSGKKQTTFNFVKACMKALEMTTSREVVSKKSASKGGKK